MTSQQIGSSAGRTAFLVEFALAVGGFGIGTGEFAAMGLLPDVAGDFHTSVPEAGHIISAYAVGVVIGAPILAVLGAKMARRSLLLLLMLVFTLGNIASALAPSNGALVLFRFLNGFPHGAYFGVASLVAAEMAGPGKRAQAVGRVMLGLTVATLIGSPAATWLGQLLGWRAAFAAVGAIGALTLVMVWRFVPQDRPHPDAGPLRELRAFRSLQVWLTLGVGAIGFGGVFAVYSYITPTLVEVSHMSLSLVPLVLALFGTGMILGNIIGPKLADRALLPTIGGALLWDIFILGAFSLTASHAWLAAINILMIGTVFIVVPALQTRLMDVAAEAQTLAAALNHSAFNIANALGAWLGGVAIDAGFGWSSTGWVGAAFALGGLIVFVISMLSDASVRKPFRRAAEPAE